MSVERPVRVIHLITRMIVGGAQENTMLSCALIDRRRFPSVTLTGPQTGLEGELHTETRARGVPLLIEPTLVREWSLVNDWLAVFRLVRLLKRGDYDVVHTHTSKAGILGRLAARIAGVPIVIHTAHGWAFTTSQPRPLFLFYAWLERLCSLWSHAIVVVAERDREEALALGIGRPERYTLIRSGIEIGAYRDVAIGPVEARARIGLPADAYVVGFVGRLADQKAPLALVAAFRPLAAARPEARLVLVGDGELRGAVEAAVAEAGLTGRVQLLGVRRDVPELLRAFDVLALPSLWEGLPRVFPQAMAAGLPIVATRIDGAAEAIEEGVTGYLVDVGDTAAFGDRLMRLAADPTRAREMGARGRERVDEFSADRMVRQLEELYAKLARERGIVAAPDPRGEMAATGT